MNTGTPWEFVRYSAYGEPTVYPLADVNRDGVVNLDDLTAFGMGTTTGDFAATPDGEPDLDFDGDIGSSADIALFMESYDANTGQSGKGRVSSAEVGNRKGYAGYEWDHVIGMSHVRHRVYWPELGRWTRRDPLGYVDGLSLYLYVSAQSIRLTDPLGLRSGSNYYSGQSEGIDREFYGNSDASSLGDSSDNSLLDAIADVSGCMLQCMIGMTEIDIDNMMKDLINETPNTIIKEILLHSGIRLVGRVWASG